MKRIFLKKRAAALILAAACALSLLPAKAPVLAADDPTPYSLEIKRDSLTGDPRQDIISIAVSQLGYKEYRDDNGSKYSWYAKWAKTNKTNWCSEFVAWCGYMAGMPIELFPLCTDGEAYRKKFGAMGQVFLLKEGNAEHAPIWLGDLFTKEITLSEVEPGDILLIGRREGSTAPHHTCMVRKVDVKNKKIYSYDGNKGSGLSGVIKNTNKASDVYAVVKPLYQLGPLTDVTLKKSGDGYPVLSFSKRKDTDGWRVYRSDKADKGYTLLEEIPAHAGQTSLEETDSPALSLVALEHHILQTSAGDPSDSGNQPSTDDSETDSESESESESETEKSTATDPQSNTESATETETETETEKVTETESQTETDPTAGSSSGKEPAPGTPKDNQSNPPGQKDSETKTDKETKKPEEPKKDQPVSPSLEINTATGTCTYIDRSAGKGKTWYYKVVPYVTTSNGKTYDGLGFRCKVLSTKDYKEVTLACSHKYNCFEIEAGTCKQQNTVKYVCIYCGNTFSKHERKGRHDYEKTKTVEPTVKECGRYTYTCRYCKDHYEKLFDAKSFASSSVKYNVLSSSSRTVTVTGPADKKAVSVVIPKTVKYNGKEYRVREIKKKAFRKMKNLESVTIQATLKKINTQAFYKSKKIHNITFSQKKPPTINSKVFTGIPKKATVTVPSAGYKKYKKLLTKKGYLSKKSKKKSKKKNKNKFILKKAKAAPAKSASTNNSAKTNSTSISDTPKGNTNNTIEKKK